MRKIESDFLDQFKRLEYLCNQRFGCEHGVSAYIEKMEEKDEEGRKYIENWENNYKVLKHSRWLRNKIVHEEGDVEIEKTDIKNLKFFIGQFNKMRDPLVVLTDRKEKTRKGNALTQDQINKIAIAGILVVIIIYLMVFNR